MRAIKEIYAACKSRNVGIPAQFPRLDRSAFYRAHKLDIRFLAEAARMDLITVNLRFEQVAENRTALRTQIQNSVLVRELVASSIAAITSSIASAAEIFRWPCDEGKLSEIQDKVNELYPKQPS